MPERIGAIYHYTDRKGRPVIRKIRREGAERGRKYRMEAARIQGDRLAWKTGLWEYQPEWASKAMYNLPALLHALRAGLPVYFCEGERDCDTGTALFKLATTTNWQGATDFTIEQAEWFTQYAHKGSRINILIDNDDAGHYAAHLRRRRLKAAGVDPKRIRLYRPEDPGHKDLTDVALGGLGLSALARVRPRSAAAVAKTYALSGTRVTWRIYQKGEAR